MTLFALVASHFILSPGCAFFTVDANPGYIFGMIRRAQRNGDPFWAAADIILPDESRRNEYETHLNIGMGR
jgi:hypothetical protein